jgi:peptidyl-tRNA hydrolase ICT1
LTEASFARSSGPGGQHVNRTLSKAILRLALPSPSLFPAYLLPHLRSSPHYSPSSSSLLVTSSTHRTQGTNLNECFEKLKRTLLEAARRDLVGDTSEEQKKRVQKLAASDKRRTEKVKRERKGVKEGRGKVRGWD